ncbi:MAG: hypothetical protein ACK5JU_11480 [Bacteroidales bacterium]
MNDRDRKYEKMLNRIKVQSPAPNDPQGLSDEIMSAVRRTPNQGKTNEVLKRVAMVSSVAATLLLGLFMTQHTTPKTVNTSETNVSSYSSYSEATINGKEGSTLEIVNQMIKERKEWNKKQAALYKGISNRYQND